MTASPRLYYLDDIPTPYRLGVHRLAAARWPGTYHLAFLAADEPGRAWDLDLSSLEAEILPGLQLRPPGQLNPFSFKWNPGIARSLERFRPDVVVLSGYVHPTVIRAARWCIRRGVPYAVVCETSARSTASSGWRWQVRRAAIGWIVRRMAFGLPVGREAADYLRSIGPSSAPMLAFPNTPDVSVIASEAERVRSTGLEATLRQKHGIPADGPIVLFAGRLIEAKRPLDALAAMARLGDQRRPPVLVMVGDGPLRPALEAQARGRAVVLAGWVRDAREMAGLMAIAQVMVLPSAHEPWGAVVNEALAAGTPVVASDRVTAAAELIEPGRNGWVYPVGDVVALADRLREALDLDEASRARMAAAARATAAASGHEVAAGNLITGALSALGLDPARALRAA